MSNSHYLLGDAGNLGWRFVGVDYKMTSKCEIGDYVTTDRGRGTIFDFLGVDTVRVELQSEPDLYVCGIEELKKHEKPIKYVSPQRCDCGAHVLGYSESQKEAHARWCFVNSF